MSSTTYTCRKVFADFPFAHRQHSHDGHCAWIHGHNWTFALTFAARRLDANDFVVDFGKLSFIRDWLTSMFDHTLVLNMSDPLLSDIKRMLTPTDNSTGMPLDQQLAKIVVVPNCGAEGLANFVLCHVNGTWFEADAPMICDSRTFAQYKDWEVREVRLVRVEVFEDAKNSATATWERF